MPEESSPHAAVRRLRIAGLAARLRLRRLAVLGGAAGLIFATALPAEAASPPPRPPLMCSVEVMVQSGADDLRVATGLEIWLLDNSPQRPGLKPLVFSNGGALITGGIPAGAQRTYWMRPSECVRPELIGGARVELYPGERGPLRGFDRWDLARIRIADSVSGYRYLDQENVDGRPLAQFTDDNRAWSASHPFFGSWTTGPTRTWWAVPPARPAAVNWVDVTIGSGADDLGGDDTVEVYLEVFNPRAGWRTVPLVDLTGRREISGGLPARTSRSVRLRAAQLVAAAEIRGVLVSKPGDTFLRWPDNWDLAHLRIADAVTGYRFWDQERGGATLARFTNENRDWVSWAPFRDS